MLFLFSCYMEFWVFLSQFMGLAWKTTQKLQNMQISTTLQPPTENIRKWEIKDPVLSHTHTKT